MINNPARVTYMKFDLAADMMASSGNKPKKQSSSKGLLKRFNMNIPKDEESKGDEPIDIAMKYFVAIRNERNALKNK